ncbi:AfsR/SARP family transcriptional regulator [Lentzea aerocolonigenes]|uniref:AfsR/SARP family transcriptional regulator n=1 Tax=Lentzea aerocolonigenes TaxID=68170 RepID=UPI0004C2CA01|nr:BTAD domain-containing putative transcriptional regulator [Lentzea aerocolonigenes]MCP2242177.1 DNA-binding transcriptional activator of the SARP family [Lentzea aerocolonigenes]
MDDGALSRGLTVFVLGELEVHQADRVLKNAAVGSRKARLVLAMLAVHKGYLPVDRIAFEVWGGRAPRDSGAGVATLVSRLRSVLGPRTITGGRGGGYRLAEAVRVDLTTAANLVGEAESHHSQERPATALAAARRAMTLLDAGAVLAGEPEAGWLEPARAWQARLLRRVRQVSVEAALATGDVRAAVHAAEEAAAADSFDEAACRLLMRSYRAAGEPVRALLAADRLRGVLASELGVDPAPATQQLYLAILRDTARAAG